MKEPLVGVIIGLGLLAVSIANIANTCSIREQRIRIDALEATHDQPVPANP